MVKKFLVVSKHVFISSTKIEDEQGNISNLDIEMPLQTYWKLQQLLKKADGLLAAKEQMADVQAIYLDIFKLVRPHAVYEIDRTWLVKKVKSLS